MKKHKVERTFLIFFLIVSALIVPAIAWGIDGGNVPAATRELYRRYPHLRGDRPSHEEQERHERKQKSTEAMKKGLECSKKGDYDGAIDHYREALSLNPDNTAAKTALGLALNRKAIKFHEQRDWNSAIQYYKEALEYKPNDKVIQDNLDRAQVSAKSERMWKTIEAETQRKRAEAKTKIDKMLDELTKDFDNPQVPSTSASSLRFSDASSPNALEFVSPGESLFSKGSKSSAPVDLTFMDPDKPMVVDPRVVKGEMTPVEARKDWEDEIKVKARVTLAAALVGQGDYDGAMSYLRKAEKDRPDDLGIKKAITYTMYLRDRKSMPPSPKAEALLDALEYGKGDWQRSVEYLKDAYKKDPNDLPARDALQFAEGMSGYWLHPGEIPLPSSYKAPLVKSEVQKLEDKGIQSIRAREYEKAYGYFRKAHEQSPEDLGIRDVMNFLEGAWAAQQSVE
ncbi:MAG: tetratricopeptide repeat protein [Deltaproteobacteria bacterium]|nr:tetratricopeptide repeat protein [Deltaproteobacteria bacterium]